MKNELDPKIATVIIAILVIAIGVGVYFAFFNKAKGPDITKIKDSPPPGWKMPTGKQGPATPGAQGK